MNKKTYKNYLKYLEALDSKMKINEDFSPYKLAKEIGVSNFLPTALRKLNFIVKRPTTQGARYVWNLRGVTYDQIIGAVLEARARYDKNKKDNKIEALLEKTVKEITPEELKEWENKYKTQKAEASDVPIVRINAEEKTVRIVTLEESKPYYDSSTAGDIDYNKPEAEEPAKKSSIGKTILNYLGGFAINWLAKNVVKVIFKRK